MKKNSMALLLACLAMALPLTAQSTKPDTLLVRSYLTHAPLTTLPPVTMDSLNVEGKSFDPLSLFSAPPVTHGLPQGSVVETDADGWLDAPTAQGKITLLNHTVGVLAQGFEKGTILVESSLPFRLYWDGKEVLRRDQCAMPSDANWVRAKEVSVLPSLHSITLQRIRTEKDTLPDHIRLRWVPARNPSDVCLTTNPTAYMSLEMVMHGKFMGGVSVSASGKYALLRMREVGKKYQRTYALLYHGGKLMQTLTAELANAQWLPAEDKLYYTRNQDGGRALVAYDPATATEQVRLQNLPDGSFRIAPNGNTLLYQVNNQGPAVGQDIQLMEGRDDRMAGFRSRASVALFQDNFFRPLTFGRRSSYTQDIASNSKKILVSTSCSIDTLPFYAMDVDELDTQTLTSHRIWEANPDVSAVYYTSKPNMLLVKGTANAFGGIGRNLPANAVVNTYDYQLFLYNMQTQQATPLTRTFNPSIAQVKASRSHFVAYFTAEDEDRVSLYRVDLATGKIVQLNKAEEVVRSFDTDNEDRTLYYTGQSTNSSDRFYRVDLRSLQETLVYDLSAQRLENIRLGEAHNWDFKMPNGDRVQGRYYLPPNFTTSKKYPMIVYYYGGTSPSARLFEWTYSAPMFAAQGYVVYVLNPSGTTGFGQEYAARHVNAWGKRTANEIIEAVKAFCKEHPWVNSNKIGCIGASYGGFMTQYLQTQTNLFAAAVSHAGISSIASYWGEGYWGVGYSAVASHGSYPWNNPELYVRQSPLFNADKINTPLLLLHGTADTNVPDGESTQMYNALKILGKPVAYIRVFGQDHHILDPAKREKWSYATFAWFQRWLKDDPTWWNTMFPPSQL